MRAEEFEEASRIIGAKQTFNLNVGDMPVNSHDLAVMDAMADVVRCTRPDVIIMHYDAVRKRGADRRHGDHAGAGRELPREMELQKSLCVCGRPAERPGYRRGLYRVTCFPARTAGDGRGRLGQAHSDRKAAGNDGGVGPEGRRALQGERRFDCGGLYDALRRLHSDDEEGHRRGENRQDGFRLRTVYLLVSGYPRRVAAEKDAGRL